jgi:nucleotide-binding universal stress UspA family protein
MKNLARILCAIDLEKASEPAFDRALWLARIGDAKLFLLHATPANVRFSSRARERLEYLAHLRKRAEAAGVKVRVEEQHGDPAGVIVLHANSRKVDIVVLGSNRRRGWRRFREGSVSERVCVAPAGLSSLFPGIRSLESSRKNTPERPTVGHLVGVLAIIRVGEKVFRRMGPSGPDAERLQVEDG